MAFLDSRSKIEHVIWPDAELEAVTLDYDAIVVAIKETTGRQLKIKCEGYISFTVNGFWDEVVIEQAVIHERHPAIESALASIAQRLGANQADSGSTERNRRTYACLVVRLGDGCEVVIVAARFATA